MHSFAIRQIRESSYPQGRGDSPSDISGESTRTKTNNSELQFRQASQAPTSNSQLHFGAFADEFHLRSERLRELAMKTCPEQLRTLPLSQAINLWWEHVKSPTVRKSRTLEAYGLYMKNIAAHPIGQVPVAALNLGHLLDYQNTRKEKACNSYVNHETNLMAQVLKYCDLWQYTGKHFRQLPPPEWRPPKVLTADQEEHFFKVVADHPAWKVAYWVVSVTNHTSASGSELRTLQLKHIFIAGEWEHRPKIHVPDTTAKNQFRARVIPLNEVALMQIKRILERARGLGSHDPEDYIFPLQIARGKYDPTRPASRSYIRKPFAQMCKVTGLELQPRNFRNQILTKLFENGVPDETIMAIAGHTSINMSRYYSQIRLDAKKEALSVLVPKKGVQRAG